MKNTLKLVIPIVLGVIAAAFNFLALKTSVREVSFVQAARDIEVGEIFDEGDVQKLTILAQHSENLKESAILFQDIGLLSGQFATRGIKSGDIIFYRDTEGLVGELYDFRKDDQAALPVSLRDITTPPKMRVGDYVELKIPAPRNAPDQSPQWIGPFRLVSVGNEITQNSEVRESNRISVAYESNNTAMLEKLEEFIDRSRTEDNVRLINIKLIR